MLSGKEVKLPLVALVLMFFLGMCGLIYLTTWMHSFRLSMEYPVYAEIAVLIVFVASMALGGILVSKFSDVVYVPLRVFALFSFFTSFLVILSPFFIELESRLFTLLYKEFSDSWFFLNASRITVFSLPLFFPAALIGAALTLLSANAVRFGKGIGSSVGYIYGAGGLGAAVGLFLSGFILHPFFGYNSTLIIVANINMLIAVGVFLFSFKAESTKTLFPVELGNGGSYHKIKKRTALVIALIAFTAMVYHVVLYRTAMLFTGDYLNSFIFTIGFIALSLSLGSIISSKYFCYKNTHNSLVLLSLMFSLFAVAVFILISVVNVSSYFLPSYLHGSEAILSLNGFKFIAVLFTFLFPGVMLGLIFPVTVGFYVRDKKHVGFSMSYFDLYSVIGAIGGIMISLYLVIPAFGIRGSLLFVIFLAFMLLSSFIYSSKLSTIRKQIILCLIVVVVPPLFVISPKWNTLLMVKAASSGNGGEYSEEVIASNNGLVFYNEGRVSTVAVTKDESGIMELIVNGIVEATTEKKSLAVQDILVHVAFLMHGNTEDVLMVGMGSGASLEAVVSHPEVRSIDMIELSNDVIESNKFFRTVNSESMLDWRVKVKNSDARVYMQYSDKKYDMIISSLSKPSLYSTVGYFTEEFFMTSSNALNKNGLMVQWVDAGGMSDDSLRVLMATFLEAFPFAHLWEADKEQYLLVGSLDRLSIDYKTLKRRLDIETALHSLGDIGVSRFTTVINHFIMDDGSMRKYSRGALINTDDNNYLGFHTSSDSKSSHKVEEFRVPPFLLLNNLPAETYNDMVDSYLSVLLIRDLKELLKTGDVLAVEEKIERLIDAYGYDSDVLYQLSDIYLKIGKVTVDTDLTKALECYAKSIALNDKNAEALYLQSQAYLELDMLEESLNSIEKARALSGASPRVHKVLAEIYERHGDFISAKKEQTLAIKLLTTINENL